MPRRQLCAVLCAALIAGSAQARDLSENTLAEHEIARHASLDMVFGRSSAYFDNRTTALDVVRSYYNAISLGQVARAFSYTLHATPEEEAEQLEADYQTFRDLYQDIVAVNLRYGTGFTSAGAGTEVTAVPVVVALRSSDGARSLHSACHYLVQLSPSAQDYIPFDPIRIDQSFFEAVYGAFETLPMPDCRF